MSVHEAELQAGCVPGTTGAPREEDTVVFCSRMPYGLVRVADMTYAIPAVQVVLGK